MRYSIPDVIDTEAEVLEVLTYSRGARQWRQLYKLPVEAALCLAATPILRSIHVYGDSLEPSARRIVIACAAGSGSLLRVWKRDAATQPWQLFCMVGEG